MKSVRSKFIILIWLGVIFAVVAASVLFWISDARRREKEIVRCRDQTGISIPPEARLVSQLHEGSPDGWMLDCWLFENWSGDQIDLTRNRLFEFSDWVTETPPISFGGAASRFGITPEGIPVSKRTATGRSIGRSQMTVRHIATSTEHYIYIEIITPD